MPGLRRPSARLPRLPPDLACAGWGEPTPLGANPGIEGRVGELPARARQLTPKATEEEKEAPTLETFSAASHGEVLQLVIQIVVLLAVARFLGGLAQRMGQPAVVGEILAGVISGPSILSGLCRG